VAENRSIVPAPIDKRVVEVRGFLEKATRDIARAMPKILAADGKSMVPRIDPDRFKRIILSLVGRPGMDYVTPVSFAKAAIRAASLGLDPEPTLGQFSLVPFGKELQVIVGYRGIIELALRSDRVEYVRADVVYSEDVFVYSTGLIQELKHEPNLDADQTGKEPRLAYAVALLKGGSSIVMVLPKWKIMARKARSKAVVRAQEKNAKLRPGEKQSTTPWDTDPNAMWMKTAVRALWPWLPQSTDSPVSLAVDADADVDTEDQPIEAEFNIVDGQEEATDEPPAQEGPAKPPKSGTGLKLSDFVEFEQDRLLHAMKTAEGMNRAKVEAWLATFQGNAQGALDYADERLAIKTEGSK